MPVIWPSARPGTVAQARSVQLVGEKPPSVRAPTWSHGGAFHPAHASPAEGPRDPPRAAYGDRLHGHSEAAPLSDGAAPAGLHVLGSPRDRHPGPGAISTVPGGAGGRRLGPNARPLSYAARGHPLPLSPRVLPLVAVPDARLGRC